MQEGKVVKSCILSPNSEELNEIEKILKDTIKKYQKEHSKKREKEVDQKGICMDFVYSTYTGQFYNWIYLGGR